MKVGKLSPRFSFKKKELPEFIEGSALQELGLRGTKFSGKIPESIGNLRNLTMLDLSNCQFNGTIPHFDQWPMIRWIYLSGNNLIGSLPSDGYHALRNLTTVYLSNNSISGVIPASLFSHPSLQVLHLSQNNFTGNFLLYPNISSKLSFIDLSNNKLQGPIPKLLSELVGTYWLDLSSNNFTGTVDLGFIKNYRVLSIAIL
jgi:Leucine-rich repeat (LRR) protein